MDERIAKPKTNKLEYSDEADAKELEEPETPISPVVSVSIKKTRSDAQKAATARMRVKLEERRKELVVIKQEAKETALLQQMELKTHIRDKLKAKQLKTKADEKMQQMLLEASASEEEESESEPEKIVYKKPLKKTSLVHIKQLPSRRPTYATQEFPTVRFV